MEEYKIAIALIFLLVLLLFIVFSICRLVGLWTWTMNWIFSTREEKVNLTRTDGHYNANGYLVPADSMSEINLCHSGSFKRFETVDHEYAFEMADFTSRPILQQPPGQMHDYPPDVLLPCEISDFEDDPYDYPSCSSSTSGSQPQHEEFTSVFIHSSPIQRSSSTAFIKYPPQPLRLAPSPSFSELPAHEKYESEKPEKVKCPPKRPPSPVFSQVVPPPIPPRIQPPPLPPRRFPVQSPFEREEQIPQFQGLQQGVSFESLSSDTSVALADLDGPHVTGHLCVGVDFSADTSDLFVTVLEAKDLTGLEHDGHTLMDTFVRVYLLPDKITSIQTRICRKSNCPSYKHKFRFSCSSRDFHQRSLCFYVYSAEIDECVLIGEGELRLCDVSMKQAVTTWITLTDTGQFRSDWGEVMLSLNYLPTAERLTVVVVKAKNLVFQDNRETGDPFVKVYLLNNGKKVYKKKTTTKRNERNPIYNEAMMFHISVAALQNLELRVTVAESTGEPKAFALGHVIMGKLAVGKSYSHWIQMLTSPRRPISMWHSLAK